MALVSFYIREVPIVKSTHPKIFGYNSNILQEVALIRSRQDRLQIKNYKKNRQHDQIVTNP